MVVVMLEQRAEEDDISSSKQDEILEERQAGDKNSSNHTNLQADTAGNGAGGAEEINSPPRKDLCQNTVHNSIANGLKKVYAQCVVAMTIRDDQAGNANFMVV
eukprot:7006293-Ditylum_brightwellii.AAC.2